VAIPDYQTIMLPLLQLVANQKSHSNTETINALANMFKLSNEERTELYPSGQSIIFNDRVSWAKSYLKHAGLLEYPKWGFFKITDRGLHLLREKPKRIDHQLLKQYPEYQTFIKGTKRQQPKAQDEQEKTPEELLEKSHQQINDNLSQELLELVRRCPPAFFEQLVVDLLVKMGYGGSKADASKAVGRVGDEGIDGIIKEDRLGLDVLYLQAKRWNTNVGRPEIQRFVGALQGKRASKGIFITTSEFTSEAREYVISVGINIVLINGNTLVRLMIENNLGVSQVASYDIKRVDTDYFPE